MALDLNYEPEILVPDITVLTEEEWLNWRKKGIGGSDVAAVLGISPWKTRRDLFYEKTGAEPMEEDEGNWVAKRSDTVWRILWRRSTAAKPGTSSIPSERSSSTLFSPS